MSDYDHTFSSGTKKQTRKFRELNKNNKNKRNKIFNIRKLLKSNKIDLAKKCMDDYLTEYGDDCYITHELGKYYASLAKTYEAKKCFEKNIDNNSENIYYSMYELSKIEKYHGNYEKSLQLLYDILNSPHQEKHHAELEIAKIYILQGKMKEAENILLSLINRNTSNKIYAIITLIEVYIEMHELELANEYLEQIKNNIDDLEYQFYTAIIAYYDNKIDEGRKILESIIPKNSSYKYRAIYELINLEYIVEDYSRVLELTKMLEENDLFFHFETLRLTASCYVQIGNTEKAEEYLNKMEVESIYSKHCVNYLKGKLNMKNKNYVEAIENFKDIDENYKAIYRDSIYKLICCYIKTEQYQEAYDLIDILVELDFGSKYMEHINTMKIYLCKQLNKNHGITPISYFEKQVFNYSRERALEHIKKHDSSAIKTQKSTSLFSSNIDIEYLYNIMDEKLTEETFFDNTFADRYIVKFPNAGEETDYIRVITIPNTKQIITMYPLDEKYLKWIEPCKEEKPKVRQMSRIDKFKQKYGF